MRKRLAIVVSQLLIAAVALTFISRPDSSSGAPFTDAVTDPALGFSGYATGTALHAHVDSLGALPATGAPTLPPLALPGLPPLPGLPILPALPGTGTLPIGTRLLDTELAFSGATVESAGTDNPPPQGAQGSTNETVVNELDQIVQPDLPGGGLLFGDRSYGRGSGLELSVLQALPGLPTIPVNKVEVSAPAPAGAPTTTSTTVAGATTTTDPGGAPFPPSNPVTDASSIGPIDLPPAAFADLLRGEAYADFDLTRCVSLFSRGLGYASNVQVLEGPTGALTPGPFESALLASDATNASGAPTPNRAASQTTSVTRLVPSATAGEFAIQTQARSTIAPVTLFKGTASETTIEVLGEQILTATANGTAGDLSYQQPPLIRISRPGQTPQDIQPTGGPQVVDVPSGAPVLRLTLFEPARAIGSDDATPPGAPVETATEASGAADLIRVQTLPTTAGGVTGLPVVGSTIAGLTGTTATTLTDVRIGHVEARAATPSPITCGTPPSGNLSITKTASPSTVAPNGDVTFTIRANNGNPQAVSGTTTVTDNLPAGLTFVSATGTGFTCTNAGQTVTCTSTATVPAGQPFPDITLVARAAQPTSAAGCRLSNTASITTTTPAGTATSAAASVTINDPICDTTTTSSTTTTQRPGDPNLDITKTAASPTVAPNQNTTFTLRVRNIGGGTTSGTTTVTDTLPAGLTFVSATGTGFTCTNSGQTVTCTSTQGVTAGNSFPDITVTALVGAGPPCSITNSARAGNDTDSTTIIISPCQQVGGGLIVAKTHSPDVFVAGQSGNFLLTVSNTGTTASGALTVVDTLPVGMTFLPTNTQGVSCTASGQSVTCTVPAGLAAGTATTIPLSVIVDGAVCGQTLVNTASVLGGNTATDTVLVVCPGAAAVCPAGGNQQQQQQSLVVDGSGNVTSSQSGSQQGGSGGFGAGNNQQEQQQQAAGGGAGSGGGQQGGGQQGGGGVSPSGCPGGGNQQQQQQAAVGAGAPAAAPAPAPAPASSAAAASS